MSDHSVRAATSSTWNREDEDFGVFCQRLVLEKKEDLIWMENELEQFQLLLGSVSGDQRNTIQLRCEMLKDYISKYTMLHSEPTSSRIQPVRAKIDLGIQDSILSHLLDLRNFEKRVDKLVEWRDDQRERNIYLAPYLVLIQSSGMGKTKLMYEYMQEKIRTGEDDPNTKIGDVKLLLCLQGTPNVEGGIHEELQVPTSAETAHKARDLLIEKLDGILKVNTKPGKTVVLLVDEAQHLVTKSWDGSEIGDVGFYFRCFRCWLQRKDRNVVAVFAGTTSKLTNFFEEKLSSSHSRGLGDYHADVGKKLYEPFFELTTSGAGKKDDPYDIEDEDKNTDFLRSIPFGRPLFHVLKKKKLLDGTTLERIKERLQLKPHLENTHASWLSVLSVRVQMGQTTAPMVSSLVAHGYANLTHFQFLPEQGEGVIVQHCHFPDPVLAHAAMTIMDEDHKKMKKTWSQRAMTIFSRGLCTSEKGDFGEIAAALYMLFSGDSIRKEIDPNLKTFAVPLQEWLNKMEATPIIRNGGSTHEEGKTVSFIQFCRSYIRMDAGKIALQGTFLDELHQAAYGIYLHPGAEACDILAAVSCNPSTECAMEIDSPNEDEKVTGGQKTSCQALLVSVKNRKEFTLTMMGKAISEMMKQLLGTGGVCLLILLGLDNADGPLTEDGAAIVAAQINLQLKPQNTRSLQNKQRSSDGSSISSYVVIVKEEDEYGVGTMLRCPASPGGERAEIYSSHFALENLVRRKEKVAAVLRASLRSSDMENDEVLQYTTELWEARSHSTQDTDSSVL
jgi:hypothetical protein